MKLFSYFDRSTPRKLQDEVWYSIIKNCGNRGREWTRCLTKRKSGCVDVEKTDAYSRFMTDGKVDRAILKLNDILK